MSITRTGPEQGDIPPISDWEEHVLLCLEFPGFQDLKFRLRDEPEAQVHYIQELWRELGALIEKAGGRPSFFESNRILGRWKYGDDSGRILEYLAELPAIASQLSDTLQFPFTLRGAADRGPLFPLNSFYFGPTLDRVLALLERTPDNTCLFTAEFVRARADADIFSPVESILSPTSGDIDVFATTPGHVLTPPVNNITKKRMTPREIAWREIQSEIRRLCDLIQNSGAISKEYARFLYLSMKGEGQNYDRYDNNFDTCIEQNLVIQKENAMEPEAAAFFLNDSHKRNQSALRRLSNLSELLGNYDREHRQEGEGNFVDYDLKNAQFWKQMIGFDVDFYLHLKNQRAGWR